MAGRYFNGYIKVFNTPLQLQLLISHNLTLEFLEGTAFLFFADIYLKVIISRFGKIIVQAIVALPCGC